MNRTNVQAFKLVTSAFAVARNAVAVCADTNHVTSSPRVAYYVTVLKPSVQNWLILRLFLFNVLAFIRILDIGFSQQIALFFTGLSTFAFVVIIILMLSTKRVNTYGKRSSRIVYLSAENDTTNPISSPTKQVIDNENSVVNTPGSTRKLLRWGRKVKGHSTSPRGSPKAANIFGLASKKASLKEGPECTPQRQPLGLKSNSVFNSPSIVYLGTRTPQVPHKQPTPTFAPFADLTVDVIHGEQNHLKPRKKKSTKPAGCQTKLTEITNVSTTEDELPVRRPQRKTKRAIVVISDTEDGNDTDDENDPSRATTTQQQASSSPFNGASHDPIIISDDDDEEDPCSDYIPNIKGPNFRKNSIRKQPLLPNTRAKPRNNEMVQKPQKPFKRAVSLRKKIAKDRMSLTDLHMDSTLTELGELSMSSRDSRSKRASRFTKNVLPPELQYLSALLTECSQEAPRSFDEFIEGFPSSDTFRQHSTVDLAFRKIGEASYSEVFAIGDVVLKVIPLRNETMASQTPNDDVDWPCESDCKDVLQEIKVTRELGNTCPGFIKLLGTFIVTGEYPLRLLTLWDEFNQKKESESIRPGVFTKSQAYTLLVLPNGGPDLESYKFPLKVAWRQACSVFWQTAKALAIAEASVSFEHRDLHWGQILINHTEHSLPKRRSKQHQHDVLSMDHPSYGVSATIIDLGLARMDAVSCKDQIYCIPFDDVIFEGEGDYQFDVYRMIKEVHNDGHWDKYRPITNVIWLHYLTLKLLRQKGLRPPSIKNNAPSTNEFYERRCYESLIEMETLLGGSVIHLRGGKKNRNDRTRMMFSSAGDVVLLAREKGWLF